MNSHEDGEWQSVDTFEASVGLNFLCVKFTDILYLGGEISNNQSIEVMI